MGNSDFGPLAPCPFERHFGNMPIDDPHDEIEQYVTAEVERIRSEHPEIRGIRPGEGALEWTVSVQAARHIDSATYTVEVLPERGELLIWYGEPQGDPGEGDLPLLRKAVHVYFPFPAEAAPRWKEKASLGYVLSFMLRNPTEYPPNVFTLT